MLPRSLVARYGTAAWNGMFTPPQCELTGASFIMGVQKEVNTPVHCPTSV